MKKHIFTLVFTLVLIIGIFFRFYRMKYLSTFLTDQAIELSGARDILHGDFTLIGIKTSISEVRNGAVMYYLLAPVLFLFNYHPIAGGVLQSLLSIGTIALVYFTAKKYTNKYQGLLAAFFISASPLLVKFSRQTMLAFYPLFFTALSLLVAAKIVKSQKEQQNPFTMLMGILLGFTLQIHYSGIAIVIFALLLPFALKINEKIKYFIQLIFGAFIGFSPMVLFELRNKFFNTKMFLDYLSANNKNLLTDSSFNLLNYWVDVAANLFAGERFWLGVLLIVFIIISIGKWRKSFNILEKLSFWQLIATLIFTLLFVKTLVPHYAIAAYVPLVILISGFINKQVLIMNIKNQILIYLGTILIFLWLNLPAYGLSDNHGWTMAKGWDLVGTENTAKIITNNVGNKSFNVAMVVNTQNQGIPLRYFLKNYKKEPLGFAHYSDPELLYVLAEPGTNLKDMSMWEIVSFKPFKIDKKWHIQNDFYLYRLSQIKL